MNENVKLWLAYAKDDLAFAKSGFESEFYSHVCYLAQQTIEKTFKGLLVSRDKEYPKTHDLVRLFKLCGSPEWLGDIEEELRFASLIYIPMKYPDALPGTLPDRSPNEQDAKGLLKLAEMVFKYVKAHLG